MFSLSSVNFVAFAEKLVCNVFLLLRAGTLSCIMNKKSGLEIESSNVFTMYGDFEPL